MARPVSKGTVTRTRSTTSARRSRASTWNGSNMSPGVAQRVLHLLAEAQTLIADSAIQSAAMGKQNSSTGVTLNG